MGTVSKALSLLGHFTPDQSSLGLSELARLSGMNKATVYRMLGELQAQGFVEQHGTDRNYRIGSAVLRLAKLREAAVPALDMGRHFLRQLSDATGETAHMSLLQGDTLIEMAHEYSSEHATRVFMDDAEVLSFHGTSSGLAVLGFSSPEFVNDVLGKPLERHTDLTQTDPEVLRAQLSQVRAQGFAQSTGTFERDVQTQAAPIFDATGAPIGAIAVAALITRMTPARDLEYGALVHRAAIELTQKTGGEVPECFPRPKQGAPS